MTDGVPSEFFDHLAEAWNAFDATVILEYWDVPQLLATRGRSIFLESDTEALAAIEALIAHWRGRGVAAVHMARLDQQPLPDNAARARVDWSLRDAGAAELLRFPALYTLTEEDGEWSIVATDLQGLVDAEAAAGWEPAPLG